MLLDYSFLSDFKPFKKRSPAQERYKKSYLLGVALLLVTTIVLFILQFILAPQPPVLLIRESYLALSSAKEAKADEYAAETYRQAEESWENLLRYWRSENKKWRVSRDYVELAKLALQTKTLCEEAKKKSQYQQDSLRSRITIAAALLRQKVSEYKAEYGNLPVEKSALRRMSECELLLREGEQAALRGRYHQALQCISQAESKLNGIPHEVDQLLTSYLRQLPTWRRWVEETLNWSRENDKEVIIVNKLARKLQVYRSGLLLHEFSVEFGRNWLGAKRYRGDGATPEGKYHILHKKGRKETRYYLALEIDYPNESDREAFELAKRKGEISADAHIGGLIEIHGEGGRGVNWTEGCVALKNSDMEKLYNLVDEGTPVTIVGSLNGYKK
ncbi:MAG: L,D-transpeptidase [candidate division KSB1 bacterium]|nr:L,D-transpeptidase [candidate division KSB1 bacterium]MDZ7345159.1 L,D-transpeptidase [candidate division KSB1 bacterium]